MSGQRPFVGLSYADALARELPPVRVLVDGLIEAGTVGTVAGLPETHKSFLAVAIANKVAAGSGSVLGREVRSGGPVGYWWQDDSEANELARIKRYAGLHGYGSEPVRWYLNEGLRLPADIAALRAEIEREQQALIVLDSLYNFIPGVGMKDEDAAAVFALLKAEVCDPTGAAVLVVDHAPWPTDGNRGQRRAYGSVFKAAAIRWGIYLDRDGDNLHVAASGNNVPGLPRAQAFFDRETLEVRLVEQPTAEASVEPPLIERIAHVIATFPEPPPTTDEVLGGVGVRHEEARELLKSDWRFQKVQRRPGTNGRAVGWKLSPQFVPAARTNSDELPSNTDATSSSHDPSTPRRGVRVGTDSGECSSASSSDAFAATSDGAR